MADYWKSIEKKYCDVCKCWITDNKASIAFHESGNRHKMNVQQKIWDIQKKNKNEMKNEKKLDREMRKIEQAALEASKKDMQQNPDVSMKIQNYYNFLKEEGGGDSPEEGSSSKAVGPVILHRSDKQKKADEAVITNLNKVQKGYSRIGGWDAPKFKTVGSNFLELPSKSSKSPGTALQLTAKLDEGKTVKFAEKKVASDESPVKLELGETMFKKRKLNKGNQRQRDDNN